MPSERIQRQIDRLLDEAEAALGHFDWDGVRARAEAVLRLDPGNDDARLLLGAANRDGSPKSESALHVDAFRPDAAHNTPAPPLPASFAGGRYNVRAFLGEGGTKRVYLAHDTKLDRDVAFALIKTEGLDADGIVRVGREAQAMGKLGDNAHIVTILDTGDEAGAPYIVSQYRSGGSVEDLLAKAEQRRVAPDRAMEIGEQICLALAHAHGRGIIHRDLKPGNVWFDADGNAALGDFGLAVAIDRSRMTMQGMMVGTVAYMPPEQAMGSTPDARSDLYALGAMLYEMVAGRPPFVGDDVVAVISQHLNTPPVAPSWHNPELPRALETLILRLLEKDPAQRPASASEVRQALAAIDLSKPPSIQASVIAPAQPAGKDPIYRPTFVGREAESAQLHVIFDNALSGQGALAVVVRLRRSHRWADARNARRRRPFSGTLAVLTGRNPAS